MQTAHHLERRTQDWGAAAIIGDIVTVKQVLDFHIGQQTFREGIAARYVRHKMGLLNEAIGRYGIAIAFGDVTKYQGGLPAGRIGIAQTASGVVQRDALQPSTYRRRIDRIGRVVRVGIGVGEPRRKPVSDVPVDFRFKAARNRRGGIDVLGAAQIAESHRVEAAVHPQKIGILRGREICGGNDIAECAVV